jgi:DNA-binding NtrC family response regulator
MGNGADSEPKCILVVDDDEHILKFVAQMLSAQGYQVIPAADAERAIQEFQNRAETIDLLLSDIMMPGMRGTDLARVLTQAKPDLAVVLMTGYTGTATDGAPVLEKPFSWNQLGKIVASVLEKHGKAAGQRPS